MIPYILDRLSLVQPWESLYKFGFQEIIFWIISKIIIKMELCVHYISCFSSLTSYFEKDVDSHTGVRNNTERSHVLFTQFPQW